MLRFRIALLAAMALFVFRAGPLSAQPATGRIAGTVHGADNAPVPGAPVTLRNTVTGDTRTVRTNEVVGSPRGTGLALMGLAAVEAADGRTERAVAIAAAAEALSKHAGVVIAHPMAPGLVERIEALKASIPKRELDSLVANASTLTPAAVLAMLAD